MGVHRRGRTDVGHGPQPRPICKASPETGLGVMDRARRPAGAARGRSGPSRPPPAPVSAPLAGAPAGPGAQQPPAGTVLGLCPRRQPSLRGRGGRIRVRLRRGAWWSGRGRGPSTAGHRRRFWDHEDGQVQFAHRQHCDMSPHHRQARPSAAEAIRDAPSPRPQQGRGLAGLQSVVRQGCRRGGRGSRPGRRGRGSLWLWSLQRKPGVLLRRRWGRVRGGLGHRVPRRPLAA